MIRRTFQHIPGVGPWREKDLWARGICSWDDFPGPGQGVGISPKNDATARNRIDLARTALELRDLKALAELFPPREHWRLYGEFAPDAVFFDIETDGRAEQKPTVVSLFDADGIHVFIQGRNMDALPEALGRRRLWVTFNGSCFDVPVLRMHYPELPTPEAHLDLRFIFRRLGMGSGLKKLEDHFKLSRAPHLRGVDGWDAVILWRTWRETGDIEALRYLVEYNLYDAFNLRTLMEIAFNTAVDELNLDVPKLQVFERGDVLYDVSKVLMELSPTERDLQYMAKLKARDRQLEKD